MTSHGGRRYGQSQAVRTASLVRARHRSTIILRAPFDSPSLHRLLEAEAVELIDTNPALAVIVAQTAGEIAIAQAVRQLLNEKRDVSELLEASDCMPKNYSLSNDRAAKLYTALSGHDPKADSAFSDDFRAHIELRNKIVHHGQRGIAPDVARNSLKVIGTLLDGIEDALTRRVEPKADMSEGDI